MKNKYRVFPILCLVWSAQMYGQEYPRVDYDPEKLVDEIFPQQDLDLNYEELYENLAQLLANPLDLNRATAEDLRSLFILQESQVADLLKYRSAYGDFLSIYELQSVLDLPTIYRLIPFVEVRTHNSAHGLLRRILEENNNYLILRYEQTLEDKAGYFPDADSTHRYLGTPYKLYARFRMSRPGDFSMGFTLEKDPGEQINFGSQQKAGFDYSSVHAQVMNHGKVKNILIGDYQAQFGQGLVLGGGFGMGKGSETITTLRRSTIGFAPYTSLNEYGFFRGSAMTTEPVKNLFVSGFASYLKRDGTVRSDTAGGAFLSSFLLSGFHRTVNEIQARKKVDEINYGSAVEFKKHLFHAGILAHRTTFGIPINKDQTLYNSFTFNGDNNTNVSLFLNCSLNNFSLFSEAAHTIRHGKAYVTGILGSLTKSLDVSLLFRKFDRDYFSFYSNAVSENTSAQNESGIYWGWKYLFNKRSNFSGYVDLFKFPWLRFRAYAPSNGSEVLLRLTYKPSKTTDLFLQVREEKKIRNTTTANPIVHTGTGTKRNYSMNADYSAGQLNLKTRLQYSTYRLDKQTAGFAIVQDFNFKWRRLSISTRYALFDNQDFENRQYVYERDLWLAFSYPAYNGTGLRCYFLLQYSLGKRIDVWLRWSKTAYFNTESIGAGSELIQGDSRSDLKAQVRMRF